MGPHRGNLARSRRACSAACALSSGMASPHVLEGQDESECAVTHGYTVADLEFLADAGLELTHELRVIREPPGLAGDRAGDRQLGSFYQGVFKHLPAHMLK